MGHLEVGVRWHQFQRGRGVVETHPELLILKASNLSDEERNNEEEGWKNDESMSWNDK